MTEQITTLLRIARDESDVASEQFMSRGSSRTGRGGRRPSATCSRWRTRTPRHRGHRGVRRARAGPGRGRRPDRAARGRRLTGPGQPGGRDVAVDSGQNASRGDRCAGRRQRHRERVVEAPRPARCAARPGHERPARAGAPAAAHRQDQGRTRRCRRRRGGPGPTIGPTMRRLGRAICSLMFAQVR